MPTRLGLFDGRLVSVFPRKLANTAVSATLLQGKDYATGLLNLLPNKSKAGSGGVRRGLGRKGAAIGGGVEIQELFEYRTSTGELQVLGYVSDGSIRLYNEGTGLWSILKTGLNPSGQIYAVPFNEKLIFVNGLDANFSYDGSAFADLGEFVDDTFATSKSWGSANSLTLKPGVGREDMDYQVGTNIVVTFATAGAVSATVSGSSYNSGTNTLTVTVSGTPFPAVTEAINGVQYYAKPEPFSFIFANYDRLWALTGGETKVKGFRGRSGLKVFYTDTPNNENSWFNQTGSSPTQETPYIDMTNKARKYDELVAISALSGLMAFHGRAGIYLWTGDDPSTVGSFVYQKTIPVGTLSGKLMQDFPQDTLFANRDSMRSIQRVFQTETLEVVPDLGSDVETTVKAKMVNLLASDSSLRRARSFRYDHEGFYGFKLDDESLMVYALDEASKGWTFFGGLFATATAFLGTSDGRLLVGAGDQLFAYGNDTDSDVGEIFDDNGVAIDCEWGGPWLSIGPRRWGNTGWEVIFEDAVTGTIYLDRMVDWNTRNIVTSQFGLAIDGAKWDLSLWDDAKWDGDILNPVATDKFLCDAFMFKLRFSTASGPINILGVRPIGR